MCENLKCEWWAKIGRKLSKLEKDSTWLNKRIEILEERLEGFLELQKILERLAVDKFDGTWATAQTDTKRLRQLSEMTAVEQITLAEAKKERKNARKKDSQ